MSLTASVIGPRWFDAWLLDTMV